MYSSQLLTGKKSLIGENCHEKFPHFCVEFLNLGILVEFVHAVETITETIWNSDS